MQIGLISDIHGNLPALGTVLKDIPAVDIIVCVGDVIGYNPWPAECVERVRDVASVTVQGNHDRTVRTPERYRANQMAYAGLEYALAELSEDQLRWLDDLPRTEPVGEDRFLIVHDHPEVQDRYVRPHMFSSLWSYLDGYDCLVLGHTHVQHTEVVLTGSWSIPAASASHVMRILVQPTLSSTLRRSVSISAASRTISTELSTESRKWGSQSKSARICLMALD